MDDQRKPLPKGRFQDYEIVDAIGLGGSSLCYLVKKNDTFFIMKELYPLDLAGYLFRNEQKLLLRDEKNQNLIRLLNQSRDDFLVEAKISKELSHVQREYSLPGENPYFSSLHDQFNVADSHAHYLIYQSSQGRTLDTYKSYKAKDDKSRLLENLDLLSRLAEAVSEIHNHGYLHLDLKSDNIYVLAYETPVIQVLDMGSALDRKQIYHTDMNHLIRRVSFSDRYSSMRLREINKLKYDMHFIEGMLVSTGSKDTDLPSRKWEILDIIHQLDESDDIYSLYVIMSELITGTRYEDSDLYDCIMNSEQLSFLPRAVKEDLHVRISSGLNNPSRIDRFTSDLEEFKEIVKSEGIHFVLLRSKSRIDYQNKRKSMKYKIHEGIFAECTLNDVKYSNLQVLVEEQFKDEIQQNIVILGDGGIGKSTQLMVVWDWLLKSKDSVAPFYIPLIDFQESSFDHLVDYIFHHYGGSFTDNQKDRLFKLFSEDLKHQYVFILDGFNEFTEKDKLMKQLQELSRFSRVKLIITSRIEYPGYLNHRSAVIKHLTWDQVDSFVSEFGIPKLAKNDLYRNPMILTLVCSSSEFLKADVISSKDLANLHLHDGNNRMELIANYFIAQKIKHYLKYGCMWSDKNVVLRMFAYEVVLPQIARIMFERNTNTIPRSDLVDLLFEYFSNRSEVSYKSSLMNKIFKYGSIISIQDDYINNSLLIDLLSDELSICKVGDSVSFVSEVFQDFFLAYQISREITLEDKSLIPLIKTHHMRYEVLKNAGDLLHEYRFADPFVSSRNVSHVELFLNKYRHIFDGSAGLLVKNAVELMRISRNGLILADLSYLDLTQAKLTGSLFSTIGEVDSQPASFRGSRLSKDAFKTLEHRSEVDRIIVSKDTKLIASYSKEERNTKVWNIDESKYISEFDDECDYSCFIDENHILSFNRDLFVIHEATQGRYVSSFRIKDHIVSNYGDLDTSIRIMGLIGNTIYVGFKLVEENNSIVNILSIQLVNFEFLSPDFIAEIELDEDEIYGYDLEEYVNSIFEFDQNLFIIKISHLNGRKAGVSLIEIIDVLNNDTHSKMKANIGSGFRVFQLDEKLVFMVYNQSKNLYQIVSWNLRGRSVNLLGNHRNPYYLLGVCEENRTIYSNGGSYIVFYEFINKPDAKSVVSGSMPDVGLRYDDNFSYKFIIKNHFMFLLPQNLPVIFKINLRNSNIISRCIVSREHDFKDIVCNHEFTGIVFSKKLYILDKKNMKFFKSLYETSYSWEFSYGNEDFSRREALIKGKSNFDSQRRMLHVDSVFIRSKPCYFHKYDIFGESLHDPLFVRETVEASNRNLIIYRRLKKVQLKSPESGFKELDLNAFSDLDESVHRVVGSKLLFLTCKGIVIVDLISFSFIYYHHDIFNTELPNQEKHPRYLANVRLFDYHCFDGFEYFIILENQKLKLLTVENSTIISEILELNSVQQACYTEDSLIVVDIYGEVKEHYLSSGHSISYEMVSYDEARMLKRDLYEAFYNHSPETKVIGMNCNSEHLYVLTDEMGVNIWDIRTKKFIGNFELQDTNLIGTDFTNAEF